MNIEHVSGFKYRIPKTGKMRVDATFYASEGILEDLKDEDYASLRQICNVATLPGVVEPALSMPDIHWGYGFPIGGLRPSTLRRVVWSAPVASASISTAVCGS